MLVTKHEIFRNTGNTKTSGLESLLDVAMNAWHSLIERHYLFLDGKEVPYQFNERTTSGAFGSALLLAQPGSVLAEADANKIDSITGKINPNTCRSDIEWDTYLDSKNKIRIRFESKQNRVTSNYLDSDGIEEEVFGSDGLVAESIMDIGKIQGHKRFHTKSRDNAFHVGLLFIRLINPFDKTSEFIKSTEITLAKLKTRRSITLVKNNPIKECKKKNGVKDLSDFYSCSYLHIPDNKAIPALLTIAIVYRRPESI